MSVKPTKLVKSGKPARAFGRSLADFEPLLPAERKLLKACRKGEPYVIADQRPEVATDENTIRGSFLRFLALGGDDENPVHERGVRIIGAYIQGDVDLASAHLVGDLTIRNSVFERKIILFDAHVKTLNFEASYAKQGIVADRITVSGGVFLRNQFNSEGGVRLLGAQINGDLDCKGGRLSNRTGNGKSSALSCDGMQVKGTVFLSEGFKAEGEVRLIDARIGGQLDCERGSFLNEGAGALICQGMRVSSGILFRKIIEFKGIFELSDASCATLVDDKSSWEKVSKYYLTGFSFERHSHKEPWSSADFIIWLEKDKSPGVEGFHPQPWRHLIGVLRRAERHEDANQIAIRLQEKLLKKRPNCSLLKWFLWLWGRGAGFGYKPLRLLYISFFVWLICAIAFYHAANNAIFSPTTPLMFDNLRYAHCRAEHLGRPDLKGAGNWTTCVSPGEYTTFSPWLYSLDLILPLVDLQQEKDWAPMVTKPTSVAKQKAQANDVQWSITNPAEQKESTFGRNIRLLMWFEILFGWIVSLLFVAIVSGLVRNVEKEE